MKEPIQCTCDFLVLSEPSLVVSHTHSKKSDDGRDQKLDIYMGESFQNVFCPEIKIVCLTNLFSVLL